MSIYIHLCCGTNVNFSKHTFWAKELITIYFNYRTQIHGLGFEIKLMIKSMKNYARLALEKLNE